MTPIPTPRMCSPLPVCIFILLQICFVPLAPVHAYVDLFLSPTETANILGFTGSFFYLFNGELRVNSVRHRLEIPPSRDHIELTWKTSIPKIAVNYLVNPLGESEPASDAREENLYSMSINSTGIVPNDTTAFSFYNFKCKRGKKSSPPSDQHGQNKQLNDEYREFIDMSIEFEFSINESLSSSSISRIELLSMPSINFTIHFRKLCTDSVLVDALPASAASAGGATVRPANKTNFTIAYVILIILVASLMLLGFGYFYYTAESRRRRELLGTAACAHPNFHNHHHIEAGLPAKGKTGAGLSKYESFSSAKSGGQRGGGAVKIYNEDLILPSHNPVPPIPHHHHHRNHHSSRPHLSAVGNGQQFRRNGSSSSACGGGGNGLPPRRVVPRPRTTRTEVNANPNNSASNIYETVPDQSTIQYPSTDEATSKEMKPIIGSAGYKSLNVTAHTIASNYNNASVMTSATALTTSGGGGGGWTRRLNPNQVEMCKKLTRDQIELEESAIIMEGTYSRIMEAQLLVVVECVVAAEDTAPEEDEDGEPAPTIISTGTTATTTTKTTTTKSRVMVKMVTERASREQSQRMLIESAMLRGLKHKNVCNVLGVYLGERGGEEGSGASHGAVVVVDEKATNLVMSVFPYFEIGNMKTFLSEIRERKFGSSRLKPDHLDEDTISMQEIIFMVLQLLKGINYLHSRHIIHRDIATRNCWLGKNLQLKLADFALSRDMFPNDYHCLADNEMKPVHWMSLESLRHGTYNTRTDVWSCGVFVWECFSFAMQPYAEIDPFEFTDYLAERESNRLEAGNCPSEIFDVFERCWRYDPLERPTLKELFNSTHQFYNSLKNYV